MCGSCRRKCPQWRVSTQDRSTSPPSPPSLPQSRQHHRFACGASGCLGPAAGFPVKRTAKPRAATSGGRQASYGDSQLEGSVLQGVCEDASGRWAEGVRLAQGVLGSERLRQRPGATHQTHQTSDPGACDIVESASVSPPPDPSSNVSLPDHSSRGRRERAASPQHACMRLTAAERLSLHAAGCSRSLSLACGWLQPKASPPTASWTRGGAPACGCLGRAV